MEQGTSREENAAAAPYAAGKQVGRRRKGPANKHESSSSEREGRATQALPIAICHLVDASLSPTPSMADPSAASDGFRGGDVMLRERREAGSGWLGSVGRQPTLSLLCPASLDGHNPIFHSKSLIFPISLTDACARGG